MVLSALQAFWTTPYGGLFGRYPSYNYDYGDQPVYSGRKLLATEESVADTLVDYGQQGLMVQNFSVESHETVQSHIDTLFDLIGDGQNIEDQIKDARNGHEGLGATLKRLRKEQATLKRQRNVPTACWFSWHNTKEFNLKCVYDELVLPKPETFDGMYERDKQLLRQFRFARGSPQRQQLEMELKAAKSRSVEIRAIAGKMVERTNESLKTHSVFAPFFLKLGGNVRIIRYRSELRKGEQPQGCEPHIDSPCGMNQAPLFVRSLLPMQDAEEGGELIGFDVKRIMEHGKVVASKKRIILEDGSPRTIHYAPRPGEDGQPDENSLRDVPAYIPHEGINKKLKINPQTARAFIGARFPYRGMTEQKSFQDYRGIFRNEYMVPADPIKSSVGENMFIVTSGEFSRRMRRTKYRQSQKYGSHHSVVPVTKGGRYRLVWDSRIWVRDGYKPCTGCNLPLNHRLVRIGEQTGKIICSMCNGTGYQNCGCTDKACQCRGDEELKAEWEIDPRDHKKKGDARNVNKTKKGLGALVPLKASVPRSKDYSLTFDDAADSKLARYYSRKAEKSKRRGSRKRHYASGQDNVIDRLKEARASAPAGSQRDSDPRGSASPSREREDF